MPLSEKYCFKWDSFQDNINTALIAQREHSGFTDVTLVCEDGQQAEAHMVILAASSPFFQNLLKIKKHKHPLIFMIGMKSDDMFALIDFIYYGKVNIFQENINTFPKVGMDLQLKGLNEENIWGREEKGDKNSIEVEMENPKNSIVTKENGNPTPTKNISTLPQSHLEEQINEEVITAPKTEYLGNMKELDEQIALVIGRSENIIRNGGTKLCKAFVCQICGKEGRRTTIKDHIEVNHVEGISLPCKICGKIFGSRHSLRTHYSRPHITRNA